VRRRLLPSRRHGDRHRRHGGGDSSGDRVDLPRAAASLLALTSYYYCGGVYYQPVYQGSTVTYVVVTKPG
jgi:hypothetical protein